MRLEVTGLLSAYSIDEIARPLVALARDAAVDVDPSKAL